MKIFITKFALGRGIIVAEADVQGDYATVRLNPFDSRRFGKGDWYMSADKAVARAEWMRDKQVETLKRKADAVAAMHFTVQDDAV